MEPLYLKQLQLGPMENFVYLLGAQGAQQVAVIDPAWDPAAIDETVEADGKELTHIVLTHSHPDHVNALEPLLRKHALPVVVQKAELEVSPWLEDLGGNLRLASPGEVLDIGPLPVKLLSTPGHTPGSMCLLAEGCLLTGDTLFVNACGRTDFPGGSSEQLFESLAVLSKLPAQTKVYPGHDYGDVKVSSIARERERNPYFQLKDVKAFTAMR